MKDLKKAIKNNIPFWICLIVSIVLIIGGAVTPPPFIIDSSIFIAVGFLFAFAALGVVIKALDRGADTIVKKGDLEIKIENPDYVEK